MAFNVERAIAAVRPVVRAVIVHGEFFHYLRAARLGTGAVAVHAVDEDHRVLGIGAAYGAGTYTGRKVRVSTPLSALGHHDQCLTEDKFAVLDAAAFALNLQPDFKSEGLAKPFDRRRGIVIAKCDRKAGPARRCRFHG